MPSSSRFVKLGGFALLIGIFILGSLHSASVDASISAQATGTAASSSAGPAMPQSCPPLDTSAMMAATPQSMSAASKASTVPGYLNLEIGAVDACGVQVVQIFKGSMATGILQVDDIIVAVDCVALADLANGSMATASASSVSNCMSTNAMAANPSAMMGITGAMSNATCMTAGGTPRVTNLFFCILRQYHVGDTVTLTLWRGSQQMNVQVVLEAIPPSLLASAQATSAATAVAPTATTGSSAATATAAATTAATTAATGPATATAPATP